MVGVVAQVGEVVQRRSKVMITTISFSGLIEAIVFTFVIGFVAGFIAAVVISGPKEKS